MSKFLGDNGFGSAYSRKLGMEVNKIGSGITSIAGIYAEVKSNKYLGKFAVAATVLLAINTAYYSLDANLQNQIISNHE